MARCLLFLAAFVLGGLQGLSCFAAEPDVIPLTIADTRLGFRGFSVAPPKADNWLVRRSSDGMSLLKRMDPQKYDQKVHTFAATILTSRLSVAPQTMEEFLELRKKRDVAEGARFKVLKHEETPVARSDAFCSRYSITAEDAVPSLSQKLILEMRGLGCAHPEARELVVDVGYSERSPAGGVTESFASEGEQLLQSVRFGPVLQWDRVDQVVKAVETRRDAPSLDELRQLAELGYPIAQSAWGRALAYGAGSQNPDRSEAVRWIRRAVEQGHPGAQFNLGICFLQGIGVPISYGEAREWFIRARQQEHKEAGKVLQELERAIDKRAQGAVGDKERFPSLLNAAEKGDQKAQYELAGMYEDGRGTVADMREAIRWYKKSAELGNAQSQYYMGAIYDFGRGVAQDDGEAVKWYTQAAEQNAAQAQYNLFVMYRTGRGVPPNDSQARIWLRKAASAGHPGAKSWMQRLGER